MIYLLIFFFLLLVVKYLDILLDMSSVIVCVCVCSTIHTSDSISTYLNSTNREAYQSEDSSHNTKYFC
jgi:hypothetical protein